MKKSDARKVDSEWKLIMKNHPTFARVLLAQQAILIEASQMGDKTVDYNMCQVLNSNLPVIFRNYWTDRCHQDFGNIQMSPQLSCILDSGDGNPAACFNMNPDDSWLDIPPTFQTSPPPTVFPIIPAVKTETKAAPKKAAAQSTKKAAPKSKKSG
ncbi:MAG TPA: hypothetical protein VLH15_00790 [Dehalococcoidales bacterium]|nr:hypothetical protein [Dehalococcoidales bacterium]